MLTDQEQPRFLCPGERSNFVQAVNTHEYLNKLGCEDTSIWPRCQLSLAVSCTLDGGDTAFFHLEHHNPSICRFIGQVHQTCMLVVERCKKKLPVEPGTGVFLSIRCNECMPYHP